MQQLNAQFIPELFKQLFLKEEIVRMCSEHLDYSFIPKELSAYKILLKEIVTEYKLRGKILTTGILAQKYADSLSVQEAIVAIREAETADTEILTIQLESFIKDARFRILSQRVFDLYQEGKRDEAIALNYKESESIVSMSLRKTGGDFLRVFEDFPDVYDSITQKFSENSIDKVAFGIDPIDELSDGGAERDDTVLWIMRSGVGKSTVLRYHGLHSALRGERVLHIQLEEGREKVYLKYVQMWSNISFSALRRGLISEEQWNHIGEKLSQMMDLKRDIDVCSFDKIGDATIQDVLGRIEEYYKIRGEYPTVLIVDSLDLLRLGESSKIDTDPGLTKNRLQMCAQRLKNIATHYHLTVFTATQASNIPKEKWDDPNFCLDRSYTEGDKTLVKPFSFVFTGNATTAETAQGRMRIYADKVRDYVGTSSVHLITTDYAHGMFFDKKRYNLLKGEAAATIVSNKVEEANRRPGKAKTLSNENKAKNINTY